MNYSRRKTSRVDIGETPLGSEFPIRIQSMTSTSTMDTPGSVAQCRRICDAGADYVRLTAQGVREANNIGEIRRILRSEGYSVPLIADIHFNPSAAYAAARVVDKVRINPGNFVDAARTFKTLTYTEEEYTRELQRIHDALAPFIDLCRQHHTAVRLGVNHGSLSDRIMSRYGDTPEGMVESVMEFLRVFEAENFHDVVISMKASNTVLMVEAVRLMVAAMDREDMHYPLHLGVTEAGTARMGLIKSAIGIGSLLQRGIGDTIRVSLTADPVEEISAARDILKGLGLWHGPRLVSCPTCGRTRIDLIGIAGEVEKRLEGCQKDITVAVMGCVVNGPGEAREADIGIAGGNGEGLLFKKGEILRKVPEEKLVDALMDEIEKL